MSFGTSLTGLNAAQSELNITGDNIANSSTWGFKESRPEFADLFASSNLGVTGLAIGQGVRLQNVGQQFSQGQFDFTENSLDLGISGKGFFRLSDDGDISYTRSGAFQLDREGWITNSAGKRLTGFAADGDGNIVGDGQQELRVETGNVAPEATTEARIQANLNAGAEIPPAYTLDADDRLADFDQLEWVGPDENNPVPGAVFDPRDTATFNESTSTTFFDSLGRQHTANFYFIKGNDNDWYVHTEVDGEVLNNGQPQPISFGPNGLIEGNATFDYTRALADAEDLDFELDLESLTQFGTPFAVSDITQDGFAAGEFSSLDVSEDGTIFARFTNGQSEVLGRVGVTKFPSQENLQPVGDTEWVATFEAGEPVVGTAGTSDFGSIESGALEQSNVDISEQLVKMIVAQRNFSANAKMISTEDQITQEILNIR